MTVHHPIVAEHGDLALALYGSFLAAAARARRHRAGRGRRRAPPRARVMVQHGEIVLNEGRPTVHIAVANRGDRPIQVGSHYHFIETNRALAFDRRAAYGMRLDIPAGTAVRFEPARPRPWRWCRLPARA